MQLVRKIKTRDNFLLNVLSLWLLVDMCNGIFLKSGFPMPISQLYKGFILVFIIINYSWYSSIKKLVFFLFLYVPLYIVITLFVDSSIHSTVTQILKPLTTFALYFYFCSLFKLYRHDILIKKIHRIFFFNAVVFFVNILIGMFGIGYRSYEGVVEMGFCGFFYSPNELSGIVAVIFPLCLAYIKQNKSFLYYIVAIAIMACTCYILSTKSPMIILACSIPAISYFYGSKLEKKIVVLMVVGLVFSLTTIIPIIMSTEYGLFTRLDYFIQQNGLVWAITSGRIEYWEEESGELYMSSPFNVLLGMGGGRTVEMDPYDVLLNMGYIGLIGLAILYYKLLSIKCFASKIYLANAIKLSNWLIVFMSIIAGHVLFSSMAGLFIALSNSLLLYNPESE